MAFHPSSMVGIAQLYQKALDEKRTSSLQLALSIDPARDCIVIHASYDNRVHKASYKDVFLGRWDIDKGDLLALRAAQYSLDKAINAVSPPQMLDGIQEYDEVMAAQQVMDDLNG